MSKRNRIFFGLMAIFAVGMAYLLYAVVSDLDPRYRESAEESLVETAQIMATLVELDARDGAIDPSRLEALFKASYARDFDAQIFSVRKTKVELRVYVTDRQGIVLYDSTGIGTGMDYSRWRDVARALRGEYGARTTRDIADDEDSTVMYVAAPVHAAGSGEILGVVSVGKPAQSIGQFVAAARQRTLSVGLISGLSVLVLAVVVSVWLVRPFGLIADYARFIKAQQGIHPLKLLRHGWALLRVAYDEMRDAITGRNYVADYVQTLTHEVKSPLSAIRGAAELLHEPMEEAQRQRFVGNIQREAQRIQEMVDRMLELTTLETRRVLDNTEAVALLPLLQDLAHAAEGGAARRGIRMTVHAAEDLTVHADPFLLRRAISNLLDNALDFSPNNGTVALALHAQGPWARITVCDQGPGIPGYARDKVFEKFYSLARPHSQKKSTGLGLSFVKEIAALHRGRIELSNRPEADGPGACATLWLPRQAD